MGNGLPKLGKSKFSNPFLPMILKDFFQRTAFKTFVLNVLNGKQREKDKSKTFKMNVFQYLFLQEIRAKIASKTFKMNV